VTTTRFTADPDQEVDEIRLVDHEQVPDDCSKDKSDVSEDEEPEPIASDDDTDTCSFKCSSSEEEESPPPQREHHGEEYQEQQELKQLLSSLDELKKKIYQLL
jgi:hypothetical protein